MGRLWLSVLGAVFLAGLLAGGRASAQGGATVVTPSQLTVAGTRGTVQTRTVLVRPGAVITGLRLVPLDLVGADGSTVFPATAIHPASVPEVVEAGSLFTVPVTFDLRGVPAGRFEGEIVLDGSSASLALPVQVTVRDRPYFPLVVLLVGVVLGVGVSIYRAQGRPRDEVLVRVGRLRARMQGGDKEAAPFYSRVEAYLVDVEVALQNGNWEEARAAVAQAEQVWLRWLKGRADWLAQLGYRKGLMERLDSCGAGPYVQAVRRQLEDLLAAMPEFAGPDELRERLDRLAQGVNRCLELEGLLNDLDELAYDDDLINRARAFRQRLAHLPVGDEGKADYRALRDEVRQVLAEARERASSGSARGERYLGAVKGGRGEGGLLERLAPPPSAHPLTAVGAVEGAGLRLRYFTWAGYAVAVILLAGAGFGELYVANPTFGAHPWGDYFSLLAWGFGAEATRASVTEMVRNWKL